MEPKDTLHYVRYSAWNRLMVFFRGLSYLLNPFHVHYLEDVGGRTRYKPSWNNKKTHFFIDLGHAIYGDFAGIGRTGGGYAIGKIHDTSTPISFWDAFFGIISKKNRV